MGATLLRDSEVQYELNDLRYAYLAPARGVVWVNGHRLLVGDGIGATDESHLTIKAEEDAEIILVASR
jgi:redox-sensitive bicupin YhaK (pirin superfamily)